METTNSQDRVMCLDRPALIVAGASEARYLVDTYFTIQEYRKAAASRIRELTESQEPHRALAWVHDQNETLEKQIRRALDSWTDTVPAARWAKSIVGVGAVVAAGLAAHIEIARCPTVGRIWRFAGLDPTQDWERGKRRPWNAALKSLCWKLGESFVSASGREGDFYGRLYVQRLEQETAANDAGEFADQARGKVGRFDTSRNCDDFKWYSSGKLPPAHIHARAKRWAVKLFLAHYHHVAWTLATGAEPAKPYVISILNRADFIKPPKFDGGAR